MVNDEDRRRFLAKATRYKRPCLKMINAETLSYSVEQVIEEAGDIEYEIDTRRDELIELFDGDEEQVMSLQWAFSDLIADIERLSERMYGLDWDEYQDCMFNIAGVNAEDVDDSLVASLENQGLIGYDDYECDFFDLQQNEAEMAVSEAGKRLMKKTKKDLIKTFRISFTFFLTCYQLMSRFDILRATYDVICGDQLAMQKELCKISELYDEQMKLEHWRRNWSYFDAAVEKLPQRMWVE